MLTRFIAVAALLPLVWTATAAEAACMRADNRPECGTAPGSVNDSRDFFAENINNGIDIKNEATERAFNDATASRNRGIDNAKQSIDAAEDQIEQAIIDYQNAQNWRERREARREFLRGVRNLYYAGKQYKYAKRVPVPILGTLIPPFNNGAGEGPGGFSSSRDTDTHNAANRSHPGRPGNSGKKTF